LKRSDTTTVALRPEAVYLMAPEAFDDISAELLRFSKDFYNARRGRSGLGYPRAVSFEGRQARPDR
jgi:hypothetical protein